MLSRRFWFSSVLLGGFALVSQAADDPYGDPIPQGARARLGTARMRTHFGGPSTITPDGKYLVGQAPNGGVTYYEPATGKVVRTVKVEGGYSTPVGFSADGRRAVNSTYDQSFVWDTTSGKTLVNIKRSAPSGDNGLSLSADGKRLAMGGVRRDKDKGVTATVWDVDGNKVLATVMPVQNETAYVALAPDGQRLATWGYHNERNAKEPPKPDADPARQVQFWNATTGKELAKVTVPGGFNPSAVVFGPDGSLAAASAANGAIYLFDPATGAAKGLLLGRSRQGRRLAFSKDGKTLAAAGDDGSIQRWSVADGKRLGNSEPPVPMSYGPRALLFLDPERVLAWGARGITAVVWEVPSGKLLTPAGGHTASIHSASVINGDQEVLTAGQDGQILRWNAATGKEVGSLVLKIPGIAPGAGLMPTATLSHDGMRALANEGSGLAVYDLPAGTQAFVIPGDNNRDNRGTFSADGTRIVQVMTSYDAKKNPAKVAVWDVAAAKRLGEVELPGVGFPAAVVTPDGKTLITAGTTQDDKGGNPHLTVTGWELATGKKLGEYVEAGGFGATSMAALADNKSVLATTSKGVVAVIDVTTGKKVRDLEIERGPQSSAPPVISPAGKTAVILFGGGYGTDLMGKAVLVDLDTGKSKKTLNGISGNPSVAVFSPDGKLLITGSHDTTALVWDLSK